MKNPKFLSVISILLLFSILFISCAGKVDDNGTSTTIKGTETETEPEVTKALSTVEVNNYDGYIYKIIVTNQDKRHVDFVAEEQNGATLNDLVYTRNSKVQELFNITISAEDKDYGSISSAAQKDATSNDSSYSLYVSNATAYSVASSGYLYPVNNMPGIDLEKPWWDQNSISGMSVAGATYLVTGDIHPTGLLTSECVLFNKNLFDNNTIQYPYDIAFEGKWTFDAMTAIAKGLTSDLNGDSKINKNDDMFSITCWFDYAHALFYGSGSHMVAKDSDDIPYLDWDIERYNSVYQKIYDLIHGTEGNYEKSDHEGSFKVFHEGRAYFCGITFQKIELFLRDMNDDYGVLPLPKYEEAQSRYVTDVSGAGSMCIWPVSIADVEIVGNITEAMAAASYDIITPALFDVIASVKNVRDEESAQMVQLIIRNRVFDMAHMYGIDGDNFVWDLLASKKNEVASYFEKKRTTAESQLSKIVNAFVENNK